MMKKQQAEQLSRILFFGALIATVVGATVQMRAQEDRATKRDMLEIFTRTLIQIERNYVEEEDPVELIQSGIEGMVQSLDPFSDFLTPDESEEWKVRTQGKFGGLGIQIGIRDGWLTVIAPIEGTPAYRAGLRAGDRIIKIEGKSTRGIKLQDAVKVLRGKPGTQVTITIKRPGVEEPLDFTITRAIIEIKSVPYYTKLDGGVGYVRLTQFSSHASREVKAAIDSLLAQGCNRFILDLRSNPGGLLREAIRVSNLFLPKGKAIVFTRGRAWNSDTVFVAPMEPEVDPEIPVVVLVDPGSASASEIVSGALQDWDRALIIGDTTFGKGSVQRIYPLGKGYQLKLTVARYYTPSGRSIHRERKRAKVSFQELIEENQDTLQADTTENEVRPVYYTKKLHRVVYGGGGIVPDIVVERKPPHSLVSKAFSKSAFFDFAVQYYNEHPDIQSIDEIQITDDLMAQFKDYLKEKGVEFTDEEFQEAKDDLRYYLSMDIAEKYFGTKGRYAMSLRTDPVVKKALEVLESAKSVEDLFAYMEQGKP